MSNRQTIIRAPRDKEHPYFSLRRKTAQDAQLSFEARGALIYLLSKPGNWTVSVPDLMREGGCGRDRVLRILKELQELGYLTKDEQTHNENGTFNPVSLLVHEVPCTENPVTVAEKPSTEKPSTGEPSTENPAHTDKKDFTNLQESQITEDKSAVADFTESLTPSGRSIIEEAAAAANGKSAQDELNDLKTEATRLAAEQRSAENLKRVTGHFENNIQMVTFVTAERIKALIDEYPADWITEAINEAVIYNARNLAYIETILKRWAAQGKDTDGRKANKAVREVTEEDRLAGIDYWGTDGETPYYVPCEANHWNPFYPPDPAFVSSESFPTADSAAGT